MGLTADQLFNYRSIPSFRSYACKVDESTIEREISFYVALGPSTERRGDSFPVYRVPDGRMVWLSDWSFNGGGIISRALSMGGSLGRIVNDGEYVYVLNAAVYAGEMQIYSPARPIRYLPGEWIAVCFHHMGISLDTRVGATFRLTEVPAPEQAIETEVSTGLSSDEEFRKE